MFCGLTIFLNIFLDSVGNVRRHFSVFVAQSTVGVSAFYTRFRAPGKKMCHSLTCERRLRPKKKSNAEGPPTCSQNVGNLKEHSVEYSQSHITLLWIHLKCLNQSFFRSSPKKTGTFYDRPGCIDGRCKVRIVHMNYELSTCP